MSNETIEPPKTVVVRREENNLLPPEAAASGAIADGGAVAVIQLPWWQMIGVRALRVYLQSLLGFLTAATTGLAQQFGVQTPVGDFGHLFLSCAGLALAPAAFSLLQNSIELLTKLDTSKPQLRA